MVEAYLGAIFIDSNFNFTVVEDFYQRHVKPYFLDMTIYDTFANKHPTVSFVANPTLLPWDKANENKTFLHNRLANEYGCTDYCLKAGEIPAVDGEPPRVLAAVLIHDTVIAEGVASSGRYAKIKASEKALDELESIGLTEFRERFICNCREADESQVVNLGTAI